MRDDWESKKIKEVCISEQNIKWENQDDEFQYIDLTSVSRETLKITETTLVNKKNAPSRAKKIVLEDDVIFSTTRPTLKRVTIIPEEYSNQICSTGYKVLRPKQEMIIPEWIYYYMQTDRFMNRMETLQKGASYPAVNYGDVNNSPIPLPPLEEQKRIVAILDDAFEAIDRAKANIERNIENAEELFQSKLNEVFYQSGEGWEKFQVKDLGEVQTGTTPSTKDESNYGDYIPFVKPAHFQADGSLESKDSMLSKKGLEKGRLFRERSVLMVCIGASIGKTGYTPIPVSSNQQINALSPNEDFDAKLIYYGMLSKNFQKQVVLNASQTTLPIINKTKWSNLSLHLPIEKSKQSDIVKNLDQLRAETLKILDFYRNKIESLEELKKSILQRAFSGELNKQQELVA